MQYVRYAEEVRTRRVAFYIGAGVSRDSGVPLSGELVTLMALSLTTEFGVSIETTDPETGEVQQKSLEAIGDEVEALGSQALAGLQAIAISAAPFRTAQPNYAHRALALLLWEGLVSVFSANWDLCFEKAAAELGFPLAITVTDADRLHRFRDALCHKVHGCASVPSSLMVTSSQVGSPPPWAESEVQAAISGKTVMFLGLGTVGDYVATRIKYVLSVVPAGAANYLVVTPRDPSPAWAELLPDGAVNNHEPESASVFLDNLLRALWNRLFTLGAQRATAMVEAGNWLDHEIVRAFERIYEVFGDADALSVLAWIRRGCGGVMAGTPAVTGSDGETLLLGLAAALDSRRLQINGAMRGFTVELEGRYVELLLARPNSRPCRRPGECSNRHASCRWRLPPRRQTGTPPMSWSGWSSACGRRDGPPCRRGADGLLDPPGHETRMALYQEGPGRGKDARPWLNPGRSITRSSMSRRVSSRLKTSTFEP